MLYDVITVGGGLAGAAFGKQMAERGYRTLILERQQHFKDRVRGEEMHPWGVAEARTLGIYDHLVATCGHQTRWWLTYNEGSLRQKRDLEETTPHRVGCLNFHHPAMQESLLRLAADAGAEVRRGVMVNAVAPGAPPCVTFDENGKQHTLQARLVVGADGRSSRVRKWGGFSVNRDPDMLIVAGTLLEGMPVPDNAVHFVQGSAGMVLIAPLGSQRARMYFIYRKDDELPPLSGKGRIPDFLTACRNAGVPEEWLEQATVVGPLAQFHGADHWANHPAHEGVVLIGDAAAASDPTFGCGLSLTLSDVRHLRDCLLATEDWQRATAQYATEHDHYYGVVHRIEGWLRELLWSRGPAADERRVRASQRIAAEPERAPDIVGLGPASPSDEAARRFLLGEDGE